jgi:protein gp37
MGQPKYIGTTRRSGGRTKWNGRINLDRASLNLPKKWRIGRTIFVNSMSDLFHRDVPVDFIREVFDIMRTTPHHTYQVLTKRAERLELLAVELPWPENVWMGVSVESAAYQWRIDHLRRIKAAIKFISLEPLIGPIDNLDLSNIDWAIAGGESGPAARPLAPDWARSIRRSVQRRRRGVSFQTMGWCEQGQSGALSRRADMGRTTAPTCTPPTGR